MYLGKASKKRVGGCPEKSFHQDSAKGTHGPSELTVCHKSGNEINKNRVKNTASSSHFRTRFIYASKHKVTLFENLLAIPKQKAIQVGLEALKRIQTTGQTKKSAPWERKVNSPAEKVRFYAEVVKADPNSKNTKSRLRDATTIPLVNDKKFQNANTTGTDRDSSSNTTFVQSNVDKNIVGYVTRDQCHRDNDTNNDQVQSQKCKIFDINGLDDKYLHSILNVPSDKKLWKNVNCEVTRAWRSQTDFEFGFIPLG